MYEILDIYNIMGKVKRPEVLKGITYKISINGNGDKVYITVNGDAEGRPIEVFINIGKNGEEERAWADSYARLISKSLQNGLDLNEIIDTMSNIKTHMPILQTDGGMRGEIIWSIPDAVAKSILKFVEDIKTYGV